MKPEPVFISLVGEPKNTAALCMRLQRLVSKNFPQHRPQFLDDPFKNYPNLKIDGMRKRDFGPEARTCFRWGFFIHYNKTVARCAIESGSDIIIVPRFGFDLYAGATAYEECVKSLVLHHALVPFGVMGLGIPAPIYVFPEPLSAELEIKKTRYFDSTYGQKRPVVLENGLSVHKKALQIMSLIERELAAKEANAA